MITIYFYQKQIDETLDIWEVNHVPRKGDEVLLNDKTYRVISVLWTHTGNVYIKVI